MQYIAKRKKQIASFAEPGWKAYERALKLQGGVQLRMDSR